MEQEQQPFALTLTVDKPLTWTSFDVVNKLRYAARTALGRKKLKVGHAGTLDPLATGLLILCFGKDTKRIHEYTGMDKVYTGTIRLGATTPSFDLETEVDAQFDTSQITETSIRAAANSLTGELDQRPPVYSAKRVDGRKAYDLARKGKAPEMKIHKVRVDRFDITAIRGEEVDFEIACSKGTYIRSLAHDLGKALNSGAHLTALRRTAIGTYGVDEANSIDAAIEAIQKAAEFH